MRHFYYVAIAFLMLLGSVMAQEPKTAAGYVERGKARFEQLNFDGAIADFDKATALKPNYAEAYFGRCLSRYNTTGRPKVEKAVLDRAMADCDKAIALNPNYAEAYS